MQLFVYAKNSAKRFSLSHRMGEGRGEGKRGLRDLSYLPLPIFLPNIFLPKSISLMLSR